LKAGKIPTTREAVEKYMKSVIDNIMRAKHIKRSIVAEICYNAMVKSAQAVLMLMGLEIRTPDRAHDEVKKRLVNTGILDAEYADWLKEIIKIRKDIKYERILEVSGSDVDKWLERAEKFAEKALSLLEPIEILKRKNVLEKTYEVMRVEVAPALIKLYGLSKGLSVGDVEKRLGMSLAEAF